MEKIVISATEAATLISMGQSLFLKKIREGEIPGYKDGDRDWKVPVKALEAYVLNRAYAEAETRKKNLAQSKADISEA